MTTNESDGPAATPADKTADKGGSFTVDFGDARNRQVRVVAMAMTFRGAYSTGKLFTSGAGRSIGDVMNGMPDIPGVRLRINCATREITIFDPLANDKELVGKIRSVLQRAPAAFQGDASQLAPVPETTSSYGEDEFKTILCELRQLIAEKVCRVVSGRFPTDQQLAQMPGFELYDPASSSSSKPRYVKDAERHYREAARR